MSTTLLRLGLWTVILVLAVYVLAETYPDEAIAEIIGTNMLQQALVVGVIAVAAGLVLRVLGKGKEAVTKDRCRVCRTPVTKGGIYCREHLRNILSDDDEKTHMTRVRR